jgi:flagellin-specific chaperone FliS
MLDRAREAIQQSDDQRLITLYEAATEQMRKAWELFRSGQFYRALKLSREVEKIAERILSEANQQLHQRENFQRRVEKVKDLLERVTAQMSECQSEAGHRLAEQARNSFELALNMARQNHPRAALKTLQTARRLAMAARRECAGGSDELLPRYERLVAEAARVAENLPLDNEQARHLMEQVRQHLQMASEFIESDKSEAAVASLKATQMTLNQLKNLLRRSGR